MKTINAIKLSSTDNCVTLAGEADPGDTVRFFWDGHVSDITALEHIPIWHKMAISPVQRGSGVLKYGSVIGLAKTDIASGEHVHIHNMSSPGDGGRS